MQLGGAVGGHVAVPVQVVRAEVEQDRGLGREGQRVVELVGGRLADDDGESPWSAGVCGR